MASRPWDTTPVSFRKSISRMLAVDGMTPGDRERADNYDEWKKKTLQARARRKPPFAREDAGRGRRQDLLSLPPSRF